MSEQQLIGTLKAAITRMMEHRTTMRRAQCVVRVLPEGIGFQCNIPAKSQAELQAGTWRIVTWDELLGMKPADAVRIADEVCKPSLEFIAAEEV